MIFGNNDFLVPEGLQTAEFLIRPLRTTDVELDYAAVMESKEFLRKWDQSTWPEAEGMDRTLLNTLRPWFEKKWDFDGYLYMTNEQLGQQVTLFEEADLQRQIEVKLPKLPGAFLAYT